MSTEKIAGFIAGTSYEQIPEAAKKDAKKAILDCIGVTLAGSKEAGSKILTEYIKEEEGKPEAGVIGCGFKALATQAAWANGTLAHALDYDDYSIYIIGHPTVAILPTALAIGEKHHLSGKEVLLSYIIGFETGAKIGPVCAGHYLVGWHTTSTIGSISAAAAAARMINLDIDKTRMTLGIAASLASGVKENFGTMTKPFHAGNASKNGIIAASLAKNGFTANERILESPQGFCRVFAGGAELELDKIGEGLGERYDIIDGIVIKPWPSCGGTHTSIEAALHLREEHNIKASDVEEIEFRIFPGLSTATIHDRPKKGLEGKFSIEYCIARALLDGEVGLNHFTDEKVMQPEAQELIHKVKNVPPAEESMDLFSPFSSEVVIKLKDDRVFSHKVDFPKGEAHNPLSWEEISAKFRDCALTTLSSKDVETCLDMVTNLEAVDDIAQLMDMLTFGSK